MVHTHSLKILHSNYSKKVKFLFNLCYILIRKLTRKNEFFCHKHVFSAIFDLNAVKILLNHEWEESVAILRIAVCCSYISALMLTFFRRTKGSTTFFWLETIVESLLHLMMVLYFKVIFYHDVNYSRCVRAAVSVYDFLATGTRSRKIFWSSGSSSAPV